MNNVRVLNPYEYYADPTKGKPVFLGSIFIGGVDLDPEVEANQIAVTGIQEDGSSVILAQPIRTSAGGVPILNGSPIQLTVKQNYSIKVLNKADEQIYYSGDVFNAIPGTVSVDTIADMTAFGNVSDGDFFKVHGYTTLGDNQARSYRWDSASTTTANGVTVFAHDTITPGRFLAEFFDITVKDGGALCDGVTDDSAEVILALVAVDHVIIPEDVVCVCNSMIELFANKTLELKGHARIRKLSGGTDPVIWMRGESCALFGASISCDILSDVPFPNGIVRLGHKDMTESHGNLTYCTLKRLRLSGFLNGGQTSGDPDICLNMPNPQIGSLVSYYHYVSELKLESANWGLVLRGFANANTISDIQGARLGNAAFKAATGDENGFVWDDGALDNSWQGSFFTDSADSLGLWVTQNDNTSEPGGALHTPNYNEWDGFVCEQGGANARALKTTHGSHNEYHIRDNVAQGNILHAGFKNTNYIFRASNGNNTMGKNIPIRQYQDQSDDEVVYGDTRLIRYTNLQENVSYEILTFDVSAARSGFIMIEFFGDDANSKSFEGSGWVSYSVSEKFDNTITAKVCGYNYDGRIRPCQPIVNANDVSIIFRVDNAAGSTSGQTLNVKITYLAINQPTFNETLTIAGAPGTALNIQTYTPTNVTPDRSFDADTVAIAELADVVGSMIVDLQEQGIFI